MYLLVFIPGYKDDLQSIYDLHAQTLGVYRNFFIQQNKITYRPRVHIMYQKQDGRAMRKIKRKKKSYYITFSSLFIYLLIIKVFLSDRSPCIK